MSLLYSPDTFAYHKARVVTTSRNAEEVPLKSVMARQEAFLDTEGKEKVFPEEEALRFYCLNHLVYVIQKERHINEPLSGEDVKIVKLYFDTLSKMSARAFYYLLIICTRESRHNKSLPAKKKTIINKFGEDVYNFFQENKKNGPGIYQTLMEDPPPTTLGNYVEAMEWLFNNCDWHKAYGGKAWGKITNCLVKFVTGEYTAEMMVDTNWTLAHNTGPIFNKKVLYHTQNTETLREILDVQRSGQIPNYILDGDMGYARKRRLTKVRESVEYVKETYGSIPSFVDWFLVEALGSVGTYSNKKESQLKTHGVPDYLVGSIPLETHPSTSKVYITPDLSVQKLTRK